MPETIRTTNERLRSRPRGGGFAASLAITTCLAAGTVPAHAQGASALDHALTVLSGLGRMEMTGLAMTLGLTLFATLATIVLVRTRARAARAEAQAQTENAALRAETDRLRTLLMSEPQVLLAWNNDDDEPALTGDPSPFLPGADARRLLAFSSWLAPRGTRQLDEALTALRNDGRAFRLTVATQTDEPVEAEGRVVAGCAILRLRPVGGVARDLAELKARHDLMLGTAQTLRGVIDALPAPIWAHDDTGLLTFVNAAYVRAIEAADATEAVDNGIEMFDRAGRTQIAQSRAKGETFTGRLPAIVGGQRRNYDVVDLPSGFGSAGIAVEATEVETMRAELGRMIDAHRRILDEMPTAVAVFDAHQQLAFHNAAYRALWELDAGFLEQSPSDSSVLDRLRAARKLPEEHDFRQWKAKLHEAYRAVEPHETMWHLPDGRSLRVVTMPNPQGGVIYLFEDVSERLAMARRYDALIKVQSETLDHLKEAVAVFGSDGRVRLHNPAFETMWKFAAGTLGERPHADAVTAWCQAQHDDNTIWRALKGAVTAIDNRQPTQARIERRDGMVIDCATLPLPDGATLVTFQDVTASVNVERALRERNEALEAADETKIEFVHHVSYELRSPLTNIIGFAHLLDDPAFGTLTPKQREYLGYITTSTNALLAIINNILDLATIDAGAMTLNLGAVDIRSAVEAAAEGVQDRLVQGHIRLDINVAPGLGSFVADERRVRQVLFNLLSNAVGFSPPGEAVTLSAERNDGVIVFKVTDRGPGIPTDAMDRVFDWFETNSFGSHHRGAGLGLSLVRSFVELHHGTVTIDSEVGRGTTVTCAFPLDQTAERSAA
ncbi:MAG: PAS-domain containing protein [Xanthobacteraceae bacterium]|uniref:PAS domain-containing sensor histidine kinase n=1 Tax=Pseudolabrys sp. TaxID=1960880 RepID=UPI003D0D6902